MLQEIGKDRYHNEYKNTTPKPDSIVLGYRDRELLLRDNGEELSFLRYWEAKELLGEEKSSEAGTLVTKASGAESSGAKTSGAKTSGAELLGGCFSDERASSIQLSGEEMLPSLIYLFRIDETAYFWMPGLASLKLAERSGQESFADPVSARTDSFGAGVDSSDPKTNSAGVREGLCWRFVDSLRAACPREIAFAGVTGYQLASWYLSRRFCPRCAHTMVHDGRERMMRCPKCGLQEYPKISPAVIVAVTDGDRLLLTRYAGRSYKKYALVAGFSEIGETIEETVAREVMEETGLRVKNLRYYKSQPWSFSGTLLMGFFAELDGSDEITLDESELAEAVWCPREEVPEDDGVSLTREMMRVFREGNF